MKVILTRDVPKVGKEGQVVEVEGGYGRNYLIPRGLAMMATRGAMKSLADMETAIARRHDRTMKDAASVAQKLDGKSVKIEAKTAPNSTKLFGAITAKDVADAIENQHSIKVDKRKIDLIDPIRSVETKEVKVHWTGEIEATVTVEVEAAAPAE